MKKLTATLLLALSFGAQSEVSDAQVEANYADSKMQGEKMCIAISQNVTHRKKEHYEYCMAVIDLVSIGGHQKGLLDARRLVDKRDQSQ